jgi:predicted Abi (CAAX) family protease
METEQARLWFLRPGNLAGCLALILFFTSFLVSDKTTSILGILGPVLLLLAGMLKPRAWLFAFAGILLLIGFVSLMLWHQD